MSTKVIPVRSPWSWCDSDDEIVADLMAASVEILLDHGGWIHPGARLVARQGQMRVECDARDGEPLISVPSDAFLRVGEMAWGGDRDALTLIDPASAPAGTDYGLLLAQIGMHNASGKIPWIAKTHPVLSTGLSGELIEAMRCFRPSFRRRRPTPASVFWSDRCFRIAVAEAPPEPVALPLLDLLDHHPRGAVGSWDGKAFTIAVAHARGTAECFMDYGLHRDALGMAIVYGFVDDANPWAHSAPLECVASDVGHVQVRARGRARSGRLLPPVVAFDDDRWVISRVSFGGEDPVATLARASGRSRSWSQEVTGAVARASLALADGLVRSAESCHDPAAVIVAGAAQRYRMVLADYAEL